MNGSEAPIGVFDSGIGGLTVVHELMRRLPHESLVYLGDTARVPYGPKSPETVRRYSDEIAHWLLAQDVKAIVVACNTATAHALTHLQSWSPVPVLGVVAPGARAAVAATKNGHVGVIGTAGTIRSGAYERALSALRPNLQVSVQACPLLVPLAEEGWTDHPATRLVVAEYLRPLIGAGIDTLVLGCTHYPLLKGVLHEALADARLIDSAEETASDVAALIGARGLAAPSDARPTYRFAATDAPEQFLRLARRFLGLADVASASDPIQHVETIALG
jgi:glutamate racemase